MHAASGTIKLLSGYNAEKKKKKTLKIFIAIFSPRVFCSASKPVVATLPPPSDVMFERKSVLSVPVLSLSGHWCFDVFVYLARPNYTLRLRGP